MAKEKAAVGTGTVSGPPEGMRRSGTATAVGWFNLGLVGNTLSGTLTGIYERPDQLRKEGTSEFFQVQIDQSCEVRSERGDDAKMVEAKPGDFVNVNFGPKTRPWKEYCRDIRRGAVYKVWGQVKSSKIKLSAGRTMHNFETFDQMVKAPTALGDTASEEDFGGDEDGEAYAEQG
jgi:hypothetical protein